MNTSKTEITGHFGFLFSIVSSIQTKTLFFIESCLLFNKTLIASKNNLQKAVLLLLFSCASNLIIAQNICNTTVNNINQQEFQFADTTIADTVWYSGNFNENVDTIWLINNGAKKVNNISIYTGNCGSLQLVDSVSFNSDTILLTGFNIAANQNFYLRLSSVLTCNSCMSVVAFSFRNLPSISSAICPFDGCNYIRNGDFELETYDCFFGNAHEPNCWSNWNTPDLFSVGCNITDLTIPNILTIPNSSSNSCDANGFVNNHYVGYWGGGSFNTFEGIGQTLHFPLQASTTYLLKFSALITNNWIGYISANVNPASSIFFTIKLKQALSTVYSNQFLLTLTDNNWHELTYSFTTPANLTPNKIYIDLDNLPQLAYVLIDNISITKDLPCASSITNATSDLCSMTRDFIFTDANCLPNNASYEWDFGDGNTITTTTNSISHTYSSTGNFNVVCTLKTYYKTCVANLPITINPLPIVNITGNTSICQGQSTNLSAGIFSSYSWSGPQSFAASTASTGNISAQGNYTVIVTDVYGCTATQTITLIVNPIPTIQLTGNTNVCYGGATSLSINSAFTNTVWSGPNSYAYSGNTAYNITYPGAYNVTTSNAYGCTAINYFNISTITSLPAPTGTSTACNIQNYCIPSTLNQLGNFITWNVPLGVSYSTLNNNTCIQVNWNTQIPAIGGNISYNYVDGYCQVVSAILVVAPCCNSFSAPSVLNFTNPTNNDFMLAYGNSNLLPPYFTIANKTFTIDGQYNLGSSFAFVNCNFIMKPNSLIYIDEAVATFNNCNFIPCTNMWQGIVLRGKNLIMNNCNVKGAKNAISNISPPLNGGLMQKININTTNFIKNYISINLLNFMDNGSNFTFSVNNSTFDGGGNLFANSYNLTKPYIGIQLNNCRAINIGTAQAGYANNFKNYINYLACCIKTQLSNFNVFNNVFENSYWAINADFINATLNSWNVNIGVSPSGTNAMNQFNYCRYPIRLIGGLSSGNNTINIMHNNFVQYNLFSNQQAIAMQLLNLYKSNINVQSNHITDFSSGIFLNNNSQQGLVRNISNNIISTNAANFISLTRGIFITETAAPASAAANVFNNSISNFLRGIEFVGAAYYRALNNTIILASPTNNNEAVGISVQGSNSAQVKDNTIYGTTTNVRSVGVDMINSLSTIVCSNNVGYLSNKIGTGFRFKGNCTGARVRLNNCRNFHHGFLLTNAGLNLAAGPIGAQGTSAQPQKNTWANMNPITGNPTSSAAHIVTNGFNGVQTGNSYNGWSYKLPWGSTQLPSNFHQVNLGIALPLPNILTSSNAGSCMPANPTPNNGNNGLPNEEEWLEIADGTAYAAMLDEKSYISKEQLYQLLRSEPVYTENTDLDAFKDSIDLGNLGEMYNFRDSLIYPIDSIIALQKIQYLENLNTGLINEGLNREVLDLALHIRGIGITGIETQVLQRLTEIAYYCPTEQGNAVFIARALVMAHDTVPHDFMSYCEIEPAEFTANARFAQLPKVGIEIFNINTTNSNSKNILIPNPAKDKVTISTNSEATSIEIYDIESKLCRKINSNYKLQVEISLKDLNAGVYTVLLKNIEGAIISYDKLFIIK